MVAEHAKTRTDGQAEHGHGQPADGISAADPVQSQPPGAASVCSTRLRLAEAGSLQRQAG
jgi:hypothetical protein